MDKKSAETYYYGACKLEDDGQIDEAIKAYGLAIEDYPLADAYNNRGLLYAEKGDNNKAIADYSNAIKYGKEQKEYKTVIYAYANRANIYKDLGNYNAMLSDYNETIRLGNEQGDKDNIEVLYFGRGLAYYNLGKKDAARADWETAAGMGHANAKHNLEVMDQESRSSSYSSSSYSPPKVSFMDKLMSKLPAIVTILVIGYLCYTFFGIIGAVIGACVGYYLGDKYGKIALIVLGVGAVLVFAFIVLSYIDNAPSISAKRGDTITVMSSSFLHSKNTWYMTAGMQEKVFIKMTEPGEEMEYLGISVFGDIRVRYNGQTAYTSISSTTANAALNAAVNAEPGTVTLEVKNGGTVFLRPETDSSYKDSLRLEKGERMTITGRPITGEDLFIPVEYDGKRYYFNDFSDVKVRK